MRLCHLEASNFRTLEDIKIDFTSNYCTISGHNNAGKSATVRVLNLILGETSFRPWAMSETEFSYEEDKTKWSSGSLPIKIGCKLILSAANDPAIISYIERTIPIEFNGEDIALEIFMLLSSKNDKNLTVLINGSEIDRLKARDIIQRLRAMQVLILHNSTNSQKEHFFRSGRPVYAYDLSLDTQNHSPILDAEEKLQKEVRKAAKAHTTELNEILGRLSGKIGVEFAAETGTRRRVPLSVNLTDKNIEVSLLEWGSGTQNRTKILMSLLQAIRAKNHDNIDNKITPIIVIEEPESFLHPSAQAEFGYVLQALSEESEVQIIAATHSPYMLNQVTPSANILLKRKLYRGKDLSAYTVPTSGNDWMIPYAEHLGIIPPEFDSWRSIIGIRGSKVLLVEGEIDKSYFSYLRDEYKTLFPIPSDVEIVSYGGKDALKNTTILKFMLDRIDKFFITFDLDAATEAKTAISRLGLEETTDYIAVGIDKAGKQAIEGLLPDKILSQVYGREVDSVMASQSANSFDRKSAKSSLKKLILEEFKSGGPYDSTELKHLMALGKIISKKFS